MSQQYTIRNVPPELDAKLRAKAARERVSLNVALLKTLDQGLQDKSTSQGRHHDFDDLAGSWVDDPAFDEAMIDVRRVDDNDWR